MRQKFAVIHTYDIIWCYIVHTICIFVFVAFLVSSSLPTSQTECHKSLFYFVVGICLLSHYHYQLQIPAIPCKCSYPCFASIVGCLRPLVCSKCPIFSLILHLLHCIVSHCKPGSIILFQVSHIQHCIVSLKPQAQLNIGYSLIPALSCWKSSQET